MISNLISIVLEFGLITFNSIIFQLCSENQSVKIVKWVKIASIDVKNLIFRLISINKNLYFFTISTVLKVSIVKNDGLVATK